MKQQLRTADFLWDLWCIASGVGIWPRFIEPHCLKVTRLELFLRGLPPQLEGIKILQFSDLHLHQRVSSRFLKKVAGKIASLSPELIVFTGDFLCHSQLIDKERMHAFLNSLQAPLGCFAVFGNHDYEKFVSINEKGEYDVIPSSNRSLIRQGFGRIFTTIPLAKQATASALKISLHKELCCLLGKTPFVLLHNKCQQVLYRGAKINICGLGEYLLGKCCPEDLLDQYDFEAPGIALLHNPDGVSLLNSLPVEIILCGHTHGGQVNLPWLWRKFTPLENEEFKSGLLFYKDKFLYINRGIGSVMPFRWFAPPELLLLTLKRSISKGT